MVRATIYWHFKIQMKLLKEYWTAILEAMDSSSYSIALTPEGSHASGTL
jgi:hypothetical protein